MASYINQGLFWQVAVGCSVKRWQFLQQGKKNSFWNIWTCLVPLASIAHGCGVSRTCTQRLDLCGAGELFFFGWNVTTRFSCHVGDDVSYPLEGLIRHQSNSRMETCMYMYIVFVSFLCGKRAHTLFRYHARDDIAPWENQSPKLLDGIHGGLRVPGSVAQGRNGLTVIRPYCWWKKSQTTTWDVKKPCKQWDFNYQPQLVSRVSKPSTVSKGQWWLW